MEGIYQNPEQNYEVAAQLQELKEIQEIDWKGVNNGLIDYSLRCTKGYHKGKFFYVGMTEEGEILGSDPDDEDITLYMENAGLDKRHVNITYTQGIYKIEDLKSETGTWIKSFGENPILVQEGLEVIIGKDHFTFHQGSEITNQVGEWLNRYGLKNYEDQMKNMGYNTVESFKNIIYSDILNLQLNEEEQASLQLAIKDMKDDVQPETVYHKLMIKHVAKNVTWEFGWEGAILGNNEMVDVNVDLQLSQGGFLKTKELYLKFQIGKYWLINSKEFPLDEFYMRIQPGDKFILKGGDIIRIGNIDLQVCRFNTGVSQDIGTKRQQEDKSVIIQDLGVSDLVDFSFFGVFDGHHGTDCVRHVVDHLPDIFRNYLLSIDTHIHTHPKFFDVVEKCLKESINQVDQDFFYKFQKFSLECGTTGCIVLVAGEFIICANIGDSRAVLCRNQKPYLLSIDHSALNPDERRRIEQAGGKVQGKYINSKIGVSRAFGDFRFKTLSRQLNLGNQNQIEDDQDIISCEPDILATQIQFFKDDFIVIGCDGLFDNLSNEEIISFVYERMCIMPIGEQDPQKISDQLVQHAKETNKEKSNKLSDNITAVIINLSRGIIPPQQLKDKKQF